MKRQVQVQRRLVRALGGHVTVRNLRRVDAPDCLNDNYTVRIGEGVKIDTLILDNVEQSLPDDKPLIRREKGVTIGNLICRSKK